MGVLRIKRRYLCDKLREKEKRHEQKSHVENFILNSLGHNDQSAQEKCKQAASLFCNQYYTKMKQCKGNFNLLTRRHAEWYNNDIEIEWNNKVAASRGRPPVQEKYASTRTKRRRGQEIGLKYSGASLLLAASMKFRKEGKLNTAKLLKIVSEDLGIADRILIYLQGQEKGPIKMTGEQGLSLLLDTDLGKAQYQSIGCVSKKQNADIFPTYNQILETKNDIFPLNKIKANDSKAEVPLQDICDHDARRVVSLLEESGASESIGEESNLEFLHKYGMDGSGQHSAYHQNFQDSPPSSDRSVLLTAISALQLREVGTEGLPLKILWSNPTPSSVRFCKPIRIQFAKETPQILKAEEIYIKDQIRTLTPSEVMTKSGKVLRIRHRLSMTMIDGKTRTFLTGRASFSRCPACNAVPVQMVLSEALQRPVDTDTYQYGLSSFHARIRFLECVLHISYKLEVQQWAVNEELTSDRKKQIISRLKEEMGILVDSVKEGSGSTNDGNTARRFFKQPDLASQITGFDKGLIQNFAIILDVLACDLEIDTKKFREFALETAANYEALYPWFKMPSSVHLVLIHGADIMENFELPIGAYSEEALEARNKNIRAFREHRTRKCCRTDTMLDLFHRLFLTGDIVLSSNRLRRAKDKESVPEHIAFLLK